MRRLVTLCDQAPATPSNMVQLVLEKELGKSVDEMFERFDWDPIGSASIAQVSCLSQPKTKSCSIECFILYLTYVSF